MEMNFIKEEKFTVQACQCYSGGYMKISSLMQSMQEIASVHVEQLGFGYGDLDKKVFTGRYRISGWIFRKCLNGMKKLYLKPGRAAVPA